jgi:hypothetical protein
MQASPFGQHLVCEITNSEDFLGVVIGVGRGVGFSHGLRPWKYLRDSGAIKQ